MIVHAGLIARHDAGRWRGVLIEGASGTPSVTGDVVASPFGARSGGGPAVRLRRRRSRPAATSQADPTASDAAAGRAAGSA